MRLSLLVGLAGSMAAQACDNGQGGVGTLPDNGQEGDAGASSTASGGNGGDSAGGSGTESGGSGGTCTISGSYPTDRDPCSLAQREACGNLAPTECSTLAYCRTFSGRPILEENGTECLGDAEPIYCLPQSVGCDAILTRVTDLDGNLWLVSADCMIPDWTTDYSDTNLEACSGS
jgi:hypothetical protein